MRHVKFTSTCTYCPAPSTFELVFLDDTDAMGTCIDHFGHGYDEAQTAIDTHGAFFTTPHITRVDTVELVPA